MRRESILFEDALKRVNVVWKFTGIQIDYNEATISQTMLGFLRKRWFYVANLFFLVTSALSLFGMLNVLTLEKILYMIPCNAFTYLGVTKSIFFIFYEKKVRDIISTLRVLQSVDESEEKENEVQSAAKKHLKFLNSSMKILRVSSYMVVATFSIGPVMVIVWQYWSTREIVLFLPFELWYPFDAYSYVGWPFAYAHQFWSAWLACFFLHGPDCFYYISCTFIYNQFCSLQYDMRKIGKDRPKDTRSFQVHMRSLVHRHNQIFRSVDMMNVLFGKSSLYNVVSSSFLICLSGFNATTIDNLVLMTPFASFVVVTSVQIYLLCYYGDLLMQASLGVSEAVYCSQWYKLDAPSMKYCLLIMLRSQKQCEITAFGFRNINLNTFAKILSSAWSYFTIIKTMYSDASSN